MRNYRDKAKFKENECTEAIIKGEGEKNRPLQVCIRKRIPQLSIH